MLATSELDLTVEHDEEEFDFALGEQGDDAGRAGAPADYRRLLSVVAGRWRHVLAGALVGLLLTGSGLLWLPKKYISSARLVYDGVPALDSDNKLAEALAVIQSAKNATRLRSVREDLGLAVTIRELEERIVITEGFDDNSMGIAAAGPTAEEAQALGAAFIGEFEQHQTRTVTDRLHKVLTETQSSRAAADDALKAARATHEAFQKKSGKVNVVKEREQLVARANKLRERADAAAIDASGQRARIVELEAAQKKLPKQVVGSSSRGSALDAPLAQARADLARARASLSDDHPTVLGLTARVNQLEAQRKAEPKGGGDTTMTLNPTRGAVDRALAEAKVALAAAKRREETLRELAKEVQNDANVLAASEAEARRVALDLKNAETHVKSLESALVSIKDASRSPTSGFRVLSPASLPEQPERSGVLLLLLALLPLLGGLLVALFYVSREMRSFTVHTPAEVAWWGRGPVLGTTTWPGDDEALETFVDEMEDHGIRGVGQTLVVPASETERDLACTLAVRLGEAPWLAAAILDVDEWRASYRGPNPLITPGAGHRQALTAGAAGGSTSRSRGPAPRPSQGGRNATSSQSFPVGGSSPGNPVARGPVVRPTSKTNLGFAPPGASAPWPQRQPLTTPPPRPAVRSSRPPRKRTIIGMPAVPGTAGVPEEAMQFEQKNPSLSDATEEQTDSQEQGVQQETPIPLSRISSNPASAASAARRLGGRVEGVARAVVRMVVRDSEPPIGDEDTKSDPPDQEQAFPLTRRADQNGASTAPRDGPAVLIGQQPPTPASTAVMRAAVRVLTDDDAAMRDFVSPSPRGPGSEPPTVVLAWNGPLSGPVVRRAARLSHRVMVVVSAGMSGLDLSRMQTRLGREHGIGYVLVNLDSKFVEYEDRVGDVESFWDGLPPGLRPAQDV